jgi:hypothetical protein
MYTKQRRKRRSRNTSMNLIRRVQILAGVAVASAAAGAAAGLVVAGLMLTTNLGHARPSLIWELIKLGSQTGAGVGVLLGPPIILSMLRRVPLRRVGTDFLAATTYGGTLGLALSMAFPQPRPVVSLVVAGSVAGLGIAAFRLRAKFRGVHERPGAEHAQVSI